MSAKNDLALAYHMGYDDALAKRKPDASKAQVLAPYDFDAENAELREKLETAKHDIAVLGKGFFELASSNMKLRELCVDMLNEDMYEHWSEFTRRALELGIEVEP